MSSRLWLLRRPAFGPADNPVELPASMPVVLLAYLALQENWVSRSHLATLLWPDAPEGSARRNLRRLISRIGEVACASDAEVEPDRLRWLVPTDVKEFRNALGQGDWQLATDLYAGQLFSGHEPASEGIAAWLEVERNSLFAAFKDAAFERITQLERAGAYSQAARLAARALAEDPFAEEFVREQMRLNYLDGHRFEALQVFARFSEMLQSELGLEPEAETVALHSQILEASDTSLESVRQTAPTVPLSLLRPGEIVGRDRELAQIAAAGSSQTLLIRGEPGIGKTRLLTAVTPDDTIYIRCLEGLQLVPLQPIADLVHSRLEHGLALPDLGNHSEDFQWILSPHDSLDYSSGRERLLESIALYLELSGSLVVFDDLQWADTATLELFSYLADRGKPALRGAYRSGEVSPQLQRTLDGLAATSTVHVKPLDEEATGDLLAHLTGRGNPPERFAAWLHRLTAGNPMFALETLRSLFETRILRLEDNDWRSTVDTFTRDYSELPAIDAVKDVIRRRIERLGEHARRVLRAVAVLGSHSRPERLAALTSLDEWQVLDAAEEANAAGFLTGTVFSHDLLRTAVYDDTGLAIRSHLHRQAASQFSEPLVRATHLAAAGDLSDAIPLWVEAHAQLLPLGLYEETLAVLDAIEAADADGEWRAETLVRRSGTLRGMNNPAGAIELAREALKMTTEPVQRASAYNNLAGAQLVLGELTEAERNARAGLEVIGTDDVLHIELTHVVANIMYQWGRYDEAAAELEALIEQVRAGGHELQLPSLLTSFGTVRGEQGYLEEALALHRESHRLAVELGQRHVQVDAILNVLATLIDLGRPAEGLELAEQGLALGQFVGTDILRNNLASAYRAAGRPEESRRHYSELAASCKDPTVRCLAWWNLARFAHDDGDHETVAGYLAAAREDVQLTEYPISRVQIGLALALYSQDEDDLQMAGELLQDVDPSSLPAHIQPDFEAAMARL